MIAEGALNIDITNGWIGCRRYLNDLDSTWHAC